MSTQFSETVRNFLKPIIHYIDDPDITEIMINSSNDIWVEEKGKLKKTDSNFKSEDDLLSAVNNISQFVGRRINKEKPCMDARLPDGSRIHAILPPCSRKGICLGIRKFSKDALTIEKLLKLNSITQETVYFLENCINARKNIIVSGGTGSGKTSLLNAISSLIPNNERIIVIEDSSELKLQQEHTVLLETKEPDRNGNGEITIRDLLKSSLRLRPDRIIIGEIRGSEALDLLQAMNTGHDGSMSTIHANSPLDSLLRLETLALFTGIDLPLKAIRAQISSAVHIIIQTSRYNDGTRKISHISEVLPLDNVGNYQVNDIFINKDEADKFKNYQAVKSKNNNILEKSKVKSSINAKIEEKKASKKQIGKGMSNSKNILQQVFHRSRVFLPVIHPVSKATALSSIKTAVESDADGIFLINQGMSISQVLDFIPEIHRLYQNLWIGVNLLGSPPEDVLDLIVNLPVGGIWSDNADIDEQSDIQPSGERFQNARQKTGWKGLYFGGVAFKYQREVPASLLPDAARKASHWMDVITSSGPGTGYAASVDKAMSLRSGAETHPLALASGVSPENVAGFLPFIDAYLVASEIETEKYSGILVPERTKLLSERIHNWNQDGA